MQQEETRESQWMGNGEAREKLAQIHQQIGAKCALNPGGSVYVTLVPAPISSSSGQPTDRQQIPLVPQPGDAPAG